MTALLLALLLSAPLALAGDPVPMVPLHLEDALTVRVDDAHVLPAGGARFHAIRQDGAVQELTIYVDIDRVHLPTLRTEAFGMQMSNVEILTLSSNTPVLIVATAQEDLLAQLNQHLGPEGELVDALPMNSAAGFPALLDLENYTFSMVVQESEAPRFEELVAPAPQ